MRRLLLMLFAVAPACAHAPPQEQAAVEPSESQADAPQKPKKHHYWYPAQLPQGDRF